MSEQPQQDAPRLGEPTDVDEVGRELDLDLDVSDEQTIDTPDELGGTGGEQSGGAG
jgi:hypothetical protein